MKAFITKSNWLIAQQCLSKAWFTLRAEPEMPSESERFRMEQGQEVGKVARDIYPRGTMISAAEGMTSADVTQARIADVTLDTLFEAEFRAGSLIARADILVRHGAGWHVLEVKSSFSDTSSMNGLVDDLAYTVMVLRRAGLQVEKASLLLLSRQYRFGGEAQTLFDEVDKTNDVNVRAVDFNRNADGVVQALFGDSQPAAVLLSACRDCDFFESDCLGVGLTHTVLELPGLHHTKLKRLSSLGIVDLSKIPSDLALNECQESAKAAAVSGAAVVKLGLRSALAAVSWPCHYLDFETVALVLPLCDGHGCHRQMLTQFSIHHRDGFGSELGHQEYLAEATRDCERELALELIEALGDSGAIIVYSHFEGTRIRALRDAFPDLIPKLQAILDRLLDLLPIIRDYIYHPEFKGSFSIKKVLPALVPDLSYKGLSIADGDTAITRFARMARGEISGDAVLTTRKELLNYCRMDTLAMVRLHERLSELAT